MKASIDGLSEILTRELKTYREKRREEPRRRTQHHGVE
jgi:ribosome-associated translation inhibitor RaiA